MFNNFEELIEYLELNHNFCSLNILSIIKAFYKANIEFPSEIIIGESIVLKWLLDANLTIKIILTKDVFVFYEYRDFKVATKWQLALEEITEDTINSIKESIDSI